MRLAFVAPGNSIHTARWVEFFARRGHAVGLVSYGPLRVPVEGTELLLELPELGSGGPRAGRPRAFLRGAVRIRRALRSFRPDLLHAHYLTGPGWLGAASGVRPLVLTGWGNDVLVDVASPLIRELHRLTVRRTDAATSESRPVSEALVALGMPPGAVHTIQWGVDTRAFHPAPQEPHDGFRVLAIRGLQPVQDPGTVIDGFSRFCVDHAATLGLMIGPLADPIPAELEARVRALEASGKLDVVEPLPHDELPALLAAADACVSMPVSDSTSVAVLEAMACGKAIVASDIPANRDLLGEGRGLLVPVGDSERLADALARLADDERLREQLGTAARGWVIEHAEAETSLLRAEALYRSLVDRTVSRQTGMHPLSSGRFRR